MSCSLLLRALNSWTSIGALILYLKLEYKYSSVSDDGLCQTITREIQVTLCKCSLWCFNRWQN